MSVDDVAVMNRETAAVTNLNIGGLDSAQIRYVDGRGYVNVTDLGIEGRAGLLKYLDEHDWTVRMETTHVPDLYLRDVSALPPPPSVFWLLERVVRG
jgi:hypothetical protein